MGCLESFQKCSIIGKDIYRIIMAMDIYRRGDVGGSGGSGGGGGERRKGVLIGHRYFIALL
jgi:hypothetical protein